MPQTYREMPQPLAEAFNYLPHQVYFRGNGYFPAPQSLDKDWGDDPMALPLIDPGWLLGGDDRWEPAIGPATNRIEVAIKRRAGSSR